MRNGRPPDNGHGRRPLLSRRAVAGTPRRTIMLIALLTAVVAGSVALAAGLLAGVIAAFAGALVAYAVTGAAARREATRRSVQQAAIAAAQRAAVEVAVAALGERDGPTADHSDDVVELAAALADRMRVDADERGRLLVAAQLHDLGKVAVPTEILHKPGPLDDDEWEVMRTHTPVGERILRSVPELADVATIVRHSHEHYDGSGYPDGLAGHQIPLSSRIILCADAYHAIRSNRPYRAGRSAGDALTEIQTHAGRQFDPQVAAALERAAHDARRGGALRGASLTGSRRLAALLLVLSIGSGAALAADGPGRSMIEDADAAGVTSHNPTGPGHPCLLLDPSSAVCAPGLSPLTAEALGLASARSASAGGGGQAGGGAAGAVTGGRGRGGLARVSGASFLPVVGPLLPAAAIRPPVGAIGSPAVGGGPGGVASPALPGAAPVGAADPRPIIWPGTPEAIESQNAGGPAGTPGAGGTGTPGAGGLGTPGVGGTAGTPGGGMPGGGNAPAPGAVPGAGAGDDRDDKKGEKGRRGRGRGGDRRGGRRGGDEDSRGRRGRGKSKGEKGDGNRGGGAPSSGGESDESDRGKGKGGKGGGGKGNGEGGGKGNGGGGKGNGGKGNGNGGGEGNSGGGNGGGGNGGNGNGGGGNGNGNGGGDDDGGEGYGGDGGDDGGGKGGDDGGGNGGGDDDDD